MTSKMSVVVGCAAAVLFSQSPVSAQEPTAYSGIVVFGTSLSDSGNAFALRGGTNTPPDYQVDPLLIPGIPFARGGHHFSDGATWIEQLGRAMGLAASVRPAYRSEGAKATNYAVGSARAREAGETVDLGEQVAAFLADHAGVAPSDALYVIEMGSSDVRDAIVAYQTGGPTAAQAILAQAIGSIAQNMQLLYQSGARHFLVWLPPNVALTPAIRQLAQANPAVAALATFLTTSFNSGLSSVLGGFSASTEMIITRFDAYSLLNAIAANPLSFGLTNVTAACITPSEAPYFCDSPDDYLFWDGIHPTRAGHALAAHEAARLLGR
jgi:phospholipase/lecithinase/hemolysin